MTFESNLDVFCFLISSATVLSSSQYDQLVTVDDQQQSMIYCSVLLTDRSSVSLIFNLTYGLTDVYFCDF